MSAGPFGHEEKCCEEEREGDDVDDDRNNDGRSRAHEVVDKIVLGGDERTGEIQQVQVREAKGDRDGVGKRLHSLFSFRAR